MYKCGNCSTVLYGTEECCPGCGKKVAFPKKEQPAPQVEKQVAPQVMDQVAEEKGVSKFKANGFKVEHLGDFPLKLEKKPE